MRALVGLLSCVLAAPVTAFGADSGATEGTALGADVRALIEHARVHSPSYAADRADRPCGEGEREELDGDYYRTIYTLEKVSPIRRVITVREEKRHRQWDGSTYAWTRRDVLTPNDIHYARVARLFGLTS